MSKTILITGASTGIGAETASLFAKNNKIIVHFNKSIQAAEKVAESVNSKGGEAHIVKADLASNEGCLQLKNYLSKTFNRLDVLVNSAGGMVTRQAARDIEWKLMEEIFALNAFSAMKVSSMCIPLLEKGSSPCIINVSSVAMRTGAPTTTIYGAAKSAIDSFTRGLAKELAPAIRVNAVAPGVIETPFHEKVSTSEQLEALRQATPLRKIGLAGHIAMVIEMLINNDFITGETVDINGGLYMR